MTPLRSFLVGFRLLGSGQRPRWRVFPLSGREPERGVEPLTYALRMWISPSNRSAPVAFHLAKAAGAVQPVQRRPSNQQEFRRQTRSFTQADERPDLAGS